MIDRKKGPKIVTEFNLDLTGTSETTLDNGLKVYEVNSGSQEIIKVELVFKSGRINEKVRAVAKAALRLLRDGSTRESSQELANIYDFYGAIVKTSSRLEYSSISIVVLERHFNNVWPHWLHMMLYPIYDLQEIEKYKQVTSRKLQDQLSKNDVIAYRALTESIFGEDHPYGYNTQPENILKLNREDILHYFNSNFGVNNALAFIGGKYSESTRQLIFNDLSKLNRIATQETQPFFKQKVKPELIQVKTTNDVQVCIKLGRQLFGRHHEDAGKLKFLNVILGGYFGSRLMRNIREEKGYTYGVYSAMTFWKESGFIYIGADVANEYMQPTIDEIRKEMLKLTQERVPEDELNMVKNYILGQGLNLLDGPFAKIHLLRDIYSKGSNIANYEKNIATVKNINSDDLIQLAVQYLDFDNYTTVLTGDI